MRCGSPDRLAYRTIRADCPKGDIPLAVARQTIFASSLGANMGSPSARPLYVAKIRVHTSMSGLVAWASPDEVRRSGSQGSGDTLPGPSHGKIA